MNRRNVRLHLLFRPLSLIDGRIKCLIEYNVLNLTNSQVRRVGAKIARLRRNWTQIIEMGFCYAITHIKGKCCARKTSKSNTKKNKNKNWRKWVKCTGNELWHNGHIHIHVILWRLRTLNVSGFIVSNLAPFRPLISHKFQALQMESFPMYGNIVCSMIRRVIVQCVDIIWFFCISFIVGKENSWSPIHVHSLALANSFSFQSIYRSVLHGDWILATRAMTTMATHFYRVPCTMLVVAIALYDYIIVVIFIFERAI